jgi:hypothetical protein
MLESQAHGRIAPYMAAGADPHPAAIIYHGFPGYEQNLDLAQTLPRGRI